MAATRPVLSQTSRLMETPLRFDRATLDDNTLADPALQRELFKLFFDQMPAHFTALEEGLDAGDVSRWRAIGHMVKGTARTLGLLELAAAAIAVEQARAVDPGLVEALRDAEAAARGAANAYLAAVAA